MVPRRGRKELPLDRKGLQVYWHLSESVVQTFEFQEASPCRGLCPFLSTSRSGASARWPKKALCAQSSPQSDEREAPEHVRLSCDVRSPECFVSMASINTSGYAARICRNTCPRLRLRFAALSVLFITTSFRVSRTLKPERTICPVSPSMTLPTTDSAPL